MKVTLYTAPASGSGFLSIPATQPSRRVEVIEDDQTTNQGLLYKLPFDKFTQQFEALVAKQPIVLGSLPNKNGRGAIIAWPIQKDQSGTVTIRPADTLIEVTSATATPTKIRVTEYD